MLQRFSGTEGRRFVIEALETQLVVAGNALLAETLCEVSHIEGVEPGSVIMAQGDPANDSCFLLSGSTSVSISGREIAVRDAGEHVGEMALLNPGQPRSATVTAIHEVVLARAPAQAFIDLANRHPSLWRNLARALSERLRQRSTSIERVNETPALFIGCSVESLAIAEVIRARLSQAEVEVNLWTEGVFKPSAFALESLGDATGPVRLCGLVPGTGRCGDQPGQNGGSAQGQRCLRTRTLHGRPGARPDVCGQAQGHRGEDTERPWGIHAADLYPGKRIRPVRGSGARLCPID